MFKDIINKIIKKRINSTIGKKIIESDNVYCHSKLIWNSDNNLVILISFTKHYLEYVLDIQDAIMCTGLRSKIVYSSYIEDITKQNEDGNTYPLTIVHKKSYLLIGGHPSDFENLYTHIEYLDNDVLYEISKEIVNNCNPENFNDLIKDGVLNGFNKDFKYDKNKVSGKYMYSDPEVMLSRLPQSFTGKDIIKFIKIYNTNNLYKADAYKELFIICFADEEQFKNSDLYNLYATLFKNPTAKKLSMLLEPMYKQTDDDSIPGDVSDESLDELFRTKYDRFSAVADNDIHYEDIDEIIEDNEEE